MGILFIIGFVVVVVLCVVIDILLGNVPWGRAEESFYHQRDQGKQQSSARAELNEMAQDCQRLQKQAGTLF